VARDVLLTPFGLDESKLLKTLGSMFTHKVDYADLYFQFTKSEGWSLEEGIVKTGSFSIDQGVGVRAVSGDKTAFSYSDEISEGAAGRRRHPHHRPPAAQVKVAGAMNRQAAARCTCRMIRWLRWTPRPRCSCWSASKRWRAPRPARGAGDGQPGRRIRRGAGGAQRWRAGGRYPSAGARVVTVIAEQNGRREMGSAAVAVATTTATSAMRCWNSTPPKPSTALVNLDARPAPAGPMTVVLGPGWPGILLHEAIGHGLEGDFNRKGSSTFSGRIGERVAAKGVTVVDDGTLAIAAVR
jgi:TldD protein